MLIAGATVRVLRNSDRLADIHLVADITSRGRFARLLQRERDREPVPDVLRDRPEINRHTVDFDELRRLPADTLGGAYVRHLDRHKLKIFVDPTSDRFIDDPDVRYLIHRYRQTHDIWHVLLGLGTAGHEEVLVHAFTLGRLGLPVSAMIVALGSIKHIVLERRWAVLRRGLWAAYTAGRDADPLLLVPWEQHWNEPLAQVRARHGIRAVPTALAH